MTFCHLWVGKGRLLLGGIQANRGSHVSNIVGSILCTIIPRSLQNAWLSVKPFKITGRLPLTLSTPRPYSRQLWRPPELEALIQIHPEQIDLTGPSWFWQARSSHQLIFAAQLKSMSATFHPCPDPLHTITWEAQLGPQTGVHQISPPPTVKPNVLKEGEVLPTKNILVSYF